MPLNVRRFCTSIFLVLVSLVSISIAQTIVETPATQPPSVEKPVGPTSGDLMRDRISKSKAFIVVRNYNAAIYELENIRKESADPAVQSVVNVLLMNSYLEQGDYKRAQDFVSDLYTQQKANKPNSSANYMAVAGQIVKGARSRADRYRALGLSVTDRTLPLEALNDLEKMRETLELVITQSRELGQIPARSQDAMAMLEEATNSRSILARDDYDARKWKDEIADTREQMVNTRSVVSAVTESPMQVASGELVAVNTPIVAPPVTTPAQPKVETKPTPVREREVKPTPNSANTNTSEKPPIIVSNVPKTEPAAPAANDGSPLNVGSLIDYATRQAPPVYPAAAKSVRATGVVKVEVTINEQGEVAEVNKTSGPSMLQGAAKDAIRKWRFKPFTKDGQPVRANGFISFNFAL